MTTTESAPTVTTVFTATFDTAILGIAPDEDGNFTQDNYVAVVKLARMFYKESFTSALLSLPALTTETATGFTGVQVTIVETEEFANIVVLRGTDPTEVSARYRGLFLAQQIRIFAATRPETRFESTPAGWTLKAESTQS